MPQILKLLSTGREPDNPTGPRFGNRFTGYGDQIDMVMGGSDMQQFADEGSFWHANSVPGTAVAGHAAPTTFDDTKAILYIQNGSSKFFFPKFLRLRLTAAGTNSTTVQFGIKTDKGTARYTSGGTAMVINNTNTDADNTSQLTGVFGAAVCAAASASARVVGHAFFRNVIGVAEDMYVMMFGAQNPALTSNATTIGAAVQNMVVGLPPICIGPGGMLLIHQFSASQSAAISFEYNFGGVLR